MDKCSIPSPPKFSGISGVVTSVPLIAHCEILSTQTRFLSISNTNACVSTGWLRRYTIQPYVHFKKPWQRAKQNVLPWNLVCIPAYFPVFCMLQRILMTKENLLKPKKNQWFLFLLFFLFPSLFLLSIFFFFFGGEATLWRNMIYWVTECAMLCTVYWSK